MQRSETWLDRLLDWIFYQAVYSSRNGRKKKVDLTVGEVALIGLTSLAIAAILGLWIVR